MPSVADSPKTAATEAPAPHAPVLIDLGKKRRKQIRDLRRGNGKLMDEVNGVMQELRMAGTISASAQPVIFVVRQRRRGRGLRWPML